MTRQTAQVFIKLQTGMPKTSEHATRWNPIRWLMVFVSGLVVCCFVTDRTWSQEARTWTDVSGKFTIEATLKEVKRDSVVLTLADGSQKTVPLEKLSTDDRQYAADFRKAMLADNAAKKKAAAEAKQRGEDLQDELKSILTDFTQREEQLKQSGSDPAGFRNSRQRLVQETGQHLLKLVEAAPQSDVARDVYLWVLRNGAQGTEGTAALQLLIQNFADSPEIIPLMGLIARDLPTLEQLLSKSKDKAVKGIATFILARQLSDADNPELEERVVKLLNEVISKYADVPDPAKRLLGPQAEQLLFAVENLRIGKVAPDIVGSDLDGVAFKLSDYRGKVVVLDFWGDW
ncbi:MAG: SHD1 domain-containing protein [Pirellulaceae bacterium]|nr:SHD1 domain-containing protein [Pirellulaceae bacterium]